MATTDTMITSIRIEPLKCKTKLACIRICPTEAIRARKGSATILDDRCIECGECLRVCPEDAIVPLTNSFVDFSKFKHTIAIPTPALYVQFRSSYAPDKILDGLLEIGFDSYFDVSKVCEATSIAVKAFIENYQGRTPLITPYCPTIVRLVQIKFPELTEQLLPIEAPMQIAAKQAKEQIARKTGLKSNEIGAIYLTPCPVKMSAIQHAELTARSYLDGAIAISDIYQPLLGALRKGKTKDQSESYKNISGIGLGWARLNGLTNNLNRERTLFVAGLENVIHVFEEIERGQMKDIDLIECHSCRGGCISGSLTVENSYTARHRTHSLQAKIGTTVTLDQDKVRKDFQDGYYSASVQVPIQPLKPLDDDLSVAITKMKNKEEILQDLPGINCGVCGAPTCQSFAEDIVLGRAELEDCFAKKEEYLEQMLKKSLDCLTKKPGEKVN